MPSSGLAEVREVKLERIKPEDDKSVVLKPTVPAPSWIGESWAMRWGWLPPLVLALGVNANVLSNGFGWDDETIIQSLRPPEHWWQIGSFFFPPSPAKEDASYFRPIVGISYLLDYAFWGRQPFGFHLSVLLVHLINTVLVYYLARALIGVHRSQSEQPQGAVLAGPGRTAVHHYAPLSASYALPLITASFFAVHPVHAEAVAWIAGRNDVFCATFILSSILLYVRFRQTAKEWVFGLSMLLFLFALLTKETAGGLVLLYPVYDYLYLPNTSPSRRSIGIQSLIPLSVLGLYVLLRICRITHPFGYFPSENVPSSLFTMIAAASVYLKTMLIPYPHNPFMTTLPRSSLLLLPAGLGLILLIGALIRRNRLIGWGLTWTAAFILPVLPLTVQNLAVTSVAERYLYVPSIGFLTALAGIILPGVNRLRAITGWNARIVWISASLLWVVLVMVLGRESSNRNAVWRSPLTFWETAVAVLSGNEPRESVAHNNLGLEYDKQHRFEEAVKEYQTALKLQPDFAEAHNNLGIVYRNLGRLEEAIHQHEIALELKPNYVEAHITLGNAYAAQKNWNGAILEYQTAIRLKPDDAIAHNDLGVVYKDLGQFGEAAGEYQAALRLRPDFSEAHHNLGAVYENLERPEDAIREYRMVLKVGPDSAEIRNSLGNAYAAQGRLEEALREYQTAIKFKPEFAEVHNNLGTTYADLGRLDEAIQEFVVALNLKPDHEGVYYNLGNAYLLKGQTREAVWAFEQALKIKPDFIPARQALASMPK